MESLVQRLRETLAMGKMVGTAQTFLQVIKNLPAIAKGEASVVISGETGTGKELVARAIHYASPRASQPFVPINCGALPETLLEDELFGHERGAFTDAHARRLGLIAQANKGTIFLDEVDALSPKAQVVLLRVLQDKRFRAIGGVCELQADVRIIAATNTALEELVRDGSFRSDLYYRLNIFSLRLPPLRERREDIQLLVAHFLGKHALQNQPAPALSAQALAALLAYEWPGNIRELENALIRGINFCQNGLIEAADLGLSRLAEKLPVMPELNEPNDSAQSELPSFKVGKQEVIEAFERDYLTLLMQKHHGNVTQAARAAGKERRDLGKLLKKYHIDPKLFGFISHAQP
jgi:DNA-binding NtrC family response regulator